jgi:hypothetical protein
LDKQTGRPHCFVKAGFGAAVDALLTNEARWLSRLGDEKTLAPHIPALVAHLAGEEFSFVAQRPLSGAIDFKMGTAQMEFLQKLQDSSLQSKQYEDSKFQRTLCSRVADLDGVLSESWSKRIKKVMRRISESLAGQAIPFVAAHNDFTPWNIRVADSRAYVFDWEFAADEQMPLFDPLHFVLLPMALNRQSTVKIIRKMDETLQLCHGWSKRERFVNARAQALAYLTNICVLYLWSVQGNCVTNPVVQSYARVIDDICPS